MSPIATGFASKEEAEAVYNKYKKLLMEDYDD